MKKILIFLLSCIMLFSISGCGKRPPQSGASNDPPVSAAADAAAVSADDNDMDSSWDEATATKISLGSSISISGGGNGFLPDSSRHR
jgi:predicted small lipoprotein YifL